MAVLGQRHLGDIVMDDLHAAAGGPYGLDISDVSVDELDVIGAVGRVYKIENAARRLIVQPLKQKGAKVARSAGYEHRRHESSDS